MALTTLLAISCAGAARAVGVAGWDFSQYFGAGFLTTDGGTFVDTLPANYSDLDPTFNAGAESGSFGTMYMNGSNGADQVPGLGAGTETFIPFTGSLASNIEFSSGSNPFESHTILEDEGQNFTSLLSMTATGAISVVFQADLSTLEQEGEGWSVLFGARMLSGTSSIAIDFSSDGASYSNVTAVDLSDVDTLFDVPLSEESSEAAYVRLSFQAPGEETGQAMIDNVTIAATSVPEPSTALLAIAALSTLAVLRTKRHA